MAVNLPEGALVLDTITIVRYMVPENESPIVATDFGDATVYDATAMLAFAWGTLHEAAMGRLDNTD